MQRKLRAIDRAEKQGRGLPCPALPPCQPRQCPIFRLRDLRGALDQLWRKSFVLELSANSPRQVISEPAWQSRPLDASLVEQSGPGTPVRRAGNFLALADNVRPHRIGKALFRHFWRGGVCKGGRNAVFLERLPDRVVQIGVNCERGPVKKRVNRGN